MRLVLYLSQCTLSRLSNKETRLYCLTVTLLIISQLTLACHFSSVSTLLGKKVTPLTSGKTVQGKLFQDESHQYQTHLETNQYLKLLIDRSGIEIGVILSGPRGYKIAEIKCRDVGSTPISLIADVAGNYQIEIRSLEKTATGSYNLKAEEPRLATEQDKIRIVGERAFAEGEQLQQKSSTESNQNAIKKFEEALVCWQSTSDKREQAYTLKYLGDVYHKLGQNQMASEYYNQALSLSQQAVDYRLEIEALNGLAYIYSLLGNPEQAKAYVYRAYGLSQENGDVRGEAKALNNLGSIFYSIGNRQEALADYCQALSLWNGLNDRTGQAQTLMDIGHIYADLSYDQEALGMYSEALRLWRVIPDRQGQALALNAIAGIYTKSGEIQKALDLYTQAEGLIEIVGDRAGQARILQFKAYTFFTLGKMERALENYDLALRIWRDIGDPHNEAGALITIGIIHHSIGKHHEALSQLEQALAVTKSFPDKKLEPHIFKNLGAVYQSLGNKKEALNNYNEAYKLHRANGYRRGEAEVLNNIGSLYTSLGNHGESIRFFTKALSLNRAIGLRFEEAQTLYNIACVEQRLRLYDRARAHIESGIDIVELLRTNVISQDLRASYFSSIHKYFRLYVDLLMRLHNKHQGQGFDAAALEISERARARSMLDLLTEAQVDIRQGVDQSLLDQERKIQQQLNSKEQERVQLIGRKGTERQLVALEKAIGTLTATYQDLQERIRATSPRYAALTLPQPLNVKEIQQQVLDDETLLLEFSLGDDRSYLWAVTQSAISSHQLPKRGEIEKLARTVYDLLREPQPWREEIYGQYWLKASKLSQMLLGEVAAQLGTKRMLIVADGVLQYIPFGALPIPTPQGSSRAKNGNAADAPIPLVERHEIVTMPSASALAVLRRETSQRRPAERAVAVFADPVFGQDDSRFIRANQPQQPAPAEQVQIAELRQTLRDFDESGSGLPRLLSSIGEAEDILKLVPAKDRMMVMGFDANRTKVTSPELSKYRIIHFATHGLLNNEHPELSGIVLSLVDRQGQPQNGFLRLYDIYNLKLPAELVVLSACRTALGKEVKGEGLIGLTRGFMYAGAARVVASLWKVDDEATAEFMKLFYRQMLERGHPPSFALTQAKREFRQQRRWNSPYYWAAFTIQGEWN